ncbi:MAG: glutaredoxin family protein [Microcystaceae cyanobacterium]
MSDMHLILYSKPDCHLCEGLQAKLEDIQRSPADFLVDFQLEIRDITTQPDWFERYQYEIPVLCVQLPTGEKPLPRLSPRATLKQLAALLQSL